MSLLNRLRPPARAPQRQPASDPARDLVEAAIDCEAAALALVETLERRREAIGAAITAGAVSPALGKRLLSKEAVDRAFHAAGICAHAGTPRAASSHRKGFIAQVKTALIGTKGAAHVQS